MVKYIIAPRSLSPMSMPMEPVPLERASNQSLNGFTQVSTPRGYLWNVDAKFNNLKPEQVNLWRALTASIEGRVNALVLPIHDRRFWPKDNQIGSTDGTPFDHDVGFDDDTDFDDYDIGDIYVSGARGDSFVTIDFLGYGDIVKPGQTIGLDKQNIALAGHDNYRVTSKTDMEDGVVTLYITPPLRRDYDGSPLSVRPSIALRFEAPTTGVLSMDFGWTGAPTITGQEYMDW